MLPSSYLSASGVSRTEERISSTESSTNVSAAVTEQPGSWHCHPAVSRLDTSGFPTSDASTSTGVLVCKLFLLVFNSHNSRFCAKRLFFDPLNVFSFEAVKVAFNNSRNKMFFFLCKQDLSRKLYSCSGAASGREVPGAKHT